jgi:hypothetical protein
MAGVFAWGMSSSKYIQAAVQNVKDYVTKTHPGTLRKMLGIWHFEEKLQKWKRIPPSEIPLFGEPLRKNRELSGVIGKSGKIRNYRDSNFSQFLPRITNSGKIRNDQE